MGIDRTLDTATDSARWEHFHHVSDIGIRGFGGSREEVFAQAALALTAVIVEPGSVIPAQRIEIEADGPDDELLFMAWIDAIIYEMATRRMLFGRFEVSIEGRHATGRAWGEPVDVPRHQPAVEVKAATFAELKVARQPDGSWLAQCVVDV